MTTYHYKPIENLDTFIWHCMCGKISELQISLPDGRYDAQSVTCASCEANILIPQHHLIEESLL